MGSDEADLLIPVITEINEVRRSGWWTYVDNEGDMPDVIAIARAKLAEDKDQASVYSRDQLRTFAKTQPPCEHGQDGGDYPKPDDGWMVCPQCRLKAGWASKNNKPLSAADQRVAEGAVLHAKYAAMEARNSRNQPPPGRITDSHHNVERYLEDITAPLSRGELR